MCSTNCAQAAGFSDPYQSATALGTAMAGASARADDVSFFAYNPAIISALAGSQVTIDVKAFAPSVRINTKQAVSPLGTVISNDGNSGNLVGDALAPGFSAAMPLAKGLTLGFGFSTPFASDTKTASAWAGRYQVLSSFVAGIDVTAALSAQVAPWLAIAAGIDVERMENRFTNLSSIPVAPGVHIDTVGYLKGSSWAAGPVAGVVLTPTSATRIGLSWKSGLTQTVEAVAGANLAGIPINKARYDLNLPSSVSAGLEHRISQDFRLFGEVQWTGWSRFKGFDIAFANGRPNDQRSINWQDTWMAAAGFGQKLTPATEFTAGVNYESGAAIAGSGTSVSPDSGKVTLGAGLIHTAEGIGHFSLSYAHVFLAESPVNAKSLENGTFTGTLSGSIHVVGLGYTRAW